MKINSVWGDIMKKEFGIARCGLACCLCSEGVRCSGEVECTGCESGKCAFAPNCENRRCSIEKGLKGCYECSEECEKGLLGKVKLRAFITFIRRYGIEKFFECLERNEQSGIVYHRQGITGDYDDFDNVEDIISFILNGKIE